jgi:hypothetical protein
VIKRMLVTVSLAAGMTAGLALPATPVSAAADGSRLAQCERSAAERLARRVAGGTDRVRARRQFNNDIARCKRNFG